MNPYRLSASRIDKEIQISWVHKLKHNFNFHRNDLRLNTFKINSCIYVGFQCTLCRKIESKPVIHYNLCPCGTIDSHPYARPIPYRPYGLQKKIRVLDIIKNMTTDQFNYIFPNDENLRRHPEQTIALREYLLTVESPFKPISKKENA